jgi:streptomycin 6-kinase
MAARETTGSIAVLADRRRPKPAATQLTPGDFEPYLTRWKLTPDGAPLQTHSSRLLPVLHGGEPAMLKIAMAEQERRACRLMVWWEGDGAARVLAHDDGVLLMERAAGARSLAAMARDGEAGDEEAARILCGALARLHAPRGAMPGMLVPIETWLGDLWPAAESRGGILARSAETARLLLSAPQDIRVLHGDLHHDNVLDGGARGWLAIDPHALVGERGFDYANIFCNPEETDIPITVGRLARRADIVAKAGGLDRRRLLMWVMTYAGLSAAWYLQDHDEAGARLPLAVAEVAAAELDRS